MSEEHSVDHPVGQQIRAERDVVAAGRDVTIQYFGNDEKLPRPTASSVLVPRQLPPDVVLFTGRAADMAQLDDLLLEAFREGLPAMVISAVAGMAGVGKTALTVHWAHRVSGSFPDGQLYVNLHGYDRRSPLPPEHALEGFLRALGALPEQIPLGIEAKTALFRTLTAGRRILVVLDNASSAEQVRPLVPGTPGCLVLVTSRSRLSGLVARDGARRITLGVLSREESLALLAAVLGSDRVSGDLSGARELAQQCAFLPLALRIAADYAAIRPYRRLMDLAAELAVGNERLDALSTPDDEVTSVRPVFSWSYQALQPSAARAFRLLGLHSGPDISLPAAAVLLGVPAGNARNLLDTLLGAHLLEKDKADRYRFHDLLRDYAAEMALLDEPEKQRRNSVRALLAWYLQVSEAGRFLLWPNWKRNESGGSIPLGLPFTTAVQAVEWYDSEIGNLVAAMRLAVEVGEYEIACQLPEALRVYFALRRPLAEWITSCEIGLSAARHLHDKRSEGMILGNLATCYFYLRQFEDSLAAREDSLAILRTDGSRLDEAMGLMNLGAAQTELARLGDAVASLKESLAIARQIGDRNCEGHALENLGALYAKKQEYEEAIVFLQQALPVFSDTGRSHAELHGLGLVLYRLAICHLGLQQYAESISYCMQGLDVQNVVGDRLTVAWTLDAQGKALQATGQVSQAIQSWQRAFAILEEIGHPGAAEITEHLANADHQAKSEAQNC